MAFRLRDKALSRSKADKTDANGADCCCAAAEAVDSDGMDRPATGSDGVCGGKPNNWWPSNGSDGTENDA